MTSSSCWRRQGHLWSPSRVNILIITIRKSILSSNASQNQRTNRKGRKAQICCWIHQLQLLLLIRKSMSLDSLVVCVTGAAGQIAYSFLPQLCRGNCFPGVKLHIRLLDITPALKVLEGVILQLEDANYPLVESIRHGDKAEEMFKDADLIVFLGGFPRKPGMERKDLLQINKKIFVEQGKALSGAKKDVKCLVIANPANTNTYILNHFSEGVDPKNITCLSRLDHNRALGQIVKKTNCKKDEVQGVYVFGNHSLTQYPCINNITVSGKPIATLVEKDWLENDFITKVQKRGGEVLQARGGSSVFSAASAIVDHLRDWFQGSADAVSMGVQSEGDYGVPLGIWCSFPVRCKDFKYQIVKDIPLSEFCHSKIAITVKELTDEIADTEIQK